MTIELTLRQEISITEIENGLDFIIDHFDPTILYFPRKVMTKIPKDQKIIYAKEETIEYFQQSEFQDCRINAYRYSPYSSQGKDSQQWTPDLIFVDLDKNNNFKNDSNFELAL